MSTSGAENASRRGYHHGNLRVELLRTAESVLRDGGTDAVTLRELARRAGVSHAAPNRHFPDRYALLLALAASGYERLGQSVAEAVEAAGAPFRAQFRALVSTFVRFAIDNSALLEVMFTMGKNGTTPELQAATSPLYAAFGSLVERGLATGELLGDDANRVKPLIIATMQGIAAFAAAGALPAPRVEALIDDACALFTA